MRRRRRQRMRRWMMRLRDRSSPLLSRSERLESLCVVCVCFWISGVGLQIGRRGSHNEDCCCGCRLCALRCVCRIGGVSQSARADDEDRPAIERRDKDTGKARNSGND